MPKRLDLAGMIDVIWISLSLHHLRAPAKLRDDARSVPTPPDAGRCCSFTTLLAPDSEDRDAVFSAGSGRGRNGQG